MVKQLGFQAVEKTLHHRIVSAIPFTAHTLHDAMLREQQPMTIAGILTAAIGMPNQAFRRFSLPNGHC